MIKEHKWITNLPIEDNRDIQDIIDNNNLKGIKVAEPKMFESNRNNSLDLSEYINKSYIGFYATDDSDQDLFWKEYSEIKNKEFGDGENDYDEDGKLHIKI